MLAAVVVRSSTDSALKQCAGSRSAVIQLRLRASARLLCSLINLCWCVSQALLAPGQESSRGGI